MILETPKRITYFQNLDGLRAVAAFGVIFAHLCYWIKYPDNSFFKGLTFLVSLGGSSGRLGVICFFVLSGFLITYLMFTEQANAGKLNVIFFYLRRILRIWPLYFFTLLVGFVIYPLILQAGGNSYHEDANWLWYVLFAANFDHIYHYYPTSTMLGVQWSVAVEEQFYLVWPLLFVTFNKTKVFPWLFVVIILGSEIFAVRIGSHIQGGDYHFLTCIRFLSCGALLAYWCHRKKELIVSILIRIKKSGTILIYIVSIVVLILQNAIMEVFPEYIYYYDIVPVILFVFIIAEQNFSENSFFKIGNSKMLTWLGKISYGLYLTHMIAINIILGIMPNEPNYFLLNVLLALFLCIGISHFSYSYFEKYFLSLKSRFSFLEKQ